MRYMIALTIAGLLIGTVSLWADRTGKSVQKRHRQVLVDAQAAGEIPADVDLNRNDFTDFGMEVSASEMWQNGILDLWYCYRIIFIPAIIVIGLVVARYWPMR